MATLLRFGQAQPPTLGARVIPFVRAPHGEREIVEFFGWNPDIYLREDGTPSPTWEREKIVSLPLPAPLRFAGRPVRSIRIHRKLQGPFAAVYDELFKAGLWHAIEPYGGGYCFRLIRGGDALSMHGFGAAVDHDPIGNPLGAPTERCVYGSTPAGLRVIQAFERQGFMWGGNFRGRKDAMHFQFGTGY